MKLEAFSSHSDMNSEHQKTLMLDVSGDANLKVTSRGKKGKKSSRNESRLLWLWRIEEDVAITRDATVNLQQKALLMKLGPPLSLFIRYHYSFDMDYLKNCVFEEFLQELALETDDCRSAEERRFQGIN